MLLEVHCTSCAKVANKTDFFKNEQQSREINFEWLNSRNVEVFNCFPIIDCFSIPNYLHHLLCLVGIWHREQSFAKICLELVKRCIV